MRSSVPYRLKGGEETKNISIVLGYNAIHHRYEMCDEGLVSSTEKVRKRKITEEV